MYHCLICLQLLLHNSDMQFALVGVGSTGHIHFKSWDFLGQIELKINLAQLHIRFPFLPGDAANLGERREGSCDTPSERPAPHVWEEPSLVTRLWVIHPPLLVFLLAPSESPIWRGENLSAREIINKSCQKLCWLPPPLPQVGSHCCVWVCLLSFPPACRLLSNDRHVRVMSLVDYEFQRVRMIPVHFVLLSEQGKVTRIDHPYPLYCYLEAIVLFSVPGLADGPKWTRPPPP